MILPKLGIMALPSLIRGLAEALTGVDHPAAKGAAKALSGLDDAVRGGQVTPEHLKEANRHIEQMAATEAAERQVTIQQVNESLRAEVTSCDPYVRRMRPTFGYLVAITWAAQMLAIAYVIMFDTKNASFILEAMESLGTIWAVGLSVLGIYVYKRSEEKRKTPL